MKQIQQSIFILIFICLLFVSSFYGCGEGNDSAPTMPFGDTASLADNEETAHLAQKIKTWIDEGALDN